MKKREFILQAFKDSKVYTKANWVFSLFTVVSDNEYTKYNTPYDYQIATKGNDYVAYIDGQWVTIEETKGTKHPLAVVEEGIEIKSQDEMIQGFSKFPFVTRLGTFFLNHYCLVSVFGARIAYQDGKVSVGGWEDMLLPLIKDRDGVDDPEAVYPDEIKRFQSACASVAGFSSIATPSATPYTMKAPPGIKEFRDKLIAKYGDRLKDPAIAAEFDKELVAYDKAFQAQDPDGGFYEPVAKKAFNISRKKLYLSHGYEQSDMQPKPEFVPRSLLEEWDIEKLPAMINSLRSGSYNRGAKTALGGEAVKFIFRILATTRIAEEDCGSKIGRLMRINRSHIGRTVILSPTNQVELTEDNIKEYLDKLYYLRSPSRCKTKHANFCLTCLGKQFKGSENSLAALASNIGSDMLNIFMAKMHGTVLATTKWRYTETIR